MSDILCRKCGEPWESYYVYEQVDKGGFDGDEGPDAKNKFLSGEGCPACHWGTHCYHCADSGKHTEWYGNTITKRTDEPCRWCKDGRPVLPDEVLDEALRSLVDGTDEDVMMYLGV